MNRHCSFSSCWSNEDLFLDYFLLVFQITTCSLRAVRSRRRCGRWRRSLSSAWRFPGSSGTSSGTEPKLRRTKRKVRASIQTNSAPQVSSIRLSHVRVWSDSSWADEGRDQSRRSSHIHSSPRTDALITGRRRTGVAVTLTPITRPAAGKSCSWRATIIVA